MRAIILTSLTADADGIRDDIWGIFPTIEAAEDFARKCAKQYRRTWYAEEWEDNIRMSQNEIVV